MAPFEEMSATEKEEFIISLAVLICADAKVEITVLSFIFFLNCRKKTLISLLRNLVIPLLLTGQLSSLLILEIRIFLNVLLLLVFIFYESVIFLGVGATAAPAAAAASTEAAPAEEKKEEEEEEEEDVDMSGGGLFGDDDDDW